MHIVCGNCFSVNRVPQERVSEEPKCGKCHQSLLDGKPVQLTAASFDKFIQRSDLPVAVDFWAEWCGPCKMFAPVFEKAAAEQKTRLRFAKLDTDSEQAIAQRYGIRSIPSLVLFKQGQEAARVAGALDGNSLRNWLASNAA
jgi:thioredoxin 2